MKHLSVLFLVGYALSGGVADAATYYVSKAGSDSYSCAQAQSTATAKLTVTVGLRCLSAGDTLLVRGGSYDEGINNGVPSGTSWSNMVRIAAYPGESVWLKPLVPFVGNNGFVVDFTVTVQYVEFDGINLDATYMPYTAVHFDDYGGANPNHIRMQNAEVIAGPTGGAGTILIGSNDNEFINLTVHGGGRAGGCGTPCGNYSFYFGGDRNLVDHCDIYDSSMAGVQIYNGSGGSADNNIVRNSRIHDITKSGDSRLWGVIVSGANNEIYNNIIYNLDYTYASTNAGVYAYSGNGNKIYNNNIYNNNTDGIYVSRNTSNTEVKNNIVFANAGSDFVTEGSGTIQSNNLFGVDPRFVSASTNNFELQAGSPAIDAGTTLSAVTTDFAGISRPQGAGSDIGAHEYLAGGPVPDTSQPPAQPSGLRIVGN